MVRDYAPYADGFKGVTLGWFHGSGERDFKDRFVEFIRGEPIVKRAWLACAEPGDGLGVHITCA
jgi:hypothetical protein